MIRLFSYLTLATSIGAFADDKYCHSVESKGEGHWPISEERFTEDNAKKAIENLNTAIESVGQEYFEPFPRNENDLLMVRGYLLKSSVGKYNGWALEEFCRFIENEAYVRH